MYKVKMITALGKVSSLEKKVNEWYMKNKDIEIVSVNTSVNLYVVTYKKSDTTGIQSRSK